MGRMVIGLLVVALFLGCVPARKTVPAVNDGLLGKIAVDRSLLQSGAAMGDELVVTPGRHGGAVITIDGGKTDELAIYLPRGGMEAYVAHLRKLVEWGDVARQEKIDTVKSVGSFSCQAEPTGGSAIIGTRFISNRGGASWLGQTRLCLIDSAAPGSGEAAASPGGNPCEREATFYLRPVEARRLLEIFTQRLALPVR